MGSQKSSNLAQHSTSCIYTAFAIGTDYILTWSGSTRRLTGANFTSRRLRGPPTTKSAWKLWKGAETRLTSTSSRNPTNLGWLTGQAMPAAPFQSQTSMKHPLEPLLLVRTHASLWQTHQATNPMHLPQRAGAPVRAACGAGLPIQTAPSWGSPLSDPAASVTSGTSCSSATWVHHRPHR